MTFHRGQKVACLDASNWQISGYGDELFPDQDGVYTVRDIVERGGVPALLLEEIKNDRLPYSVNGRIEDTEQAFAARRFKPVVSAPSRIEQLETV